MAFAKAQYVAKERKFTQFISMQNLYNLLYREEEREMIPMCRDMNVGIIPWSPLSGGNVVRKRDSINTSVRATSAFGAFFSRTAVDDVIVDRVIELASKKNVSNAQIAIAWLLHKPGVSASIIGPSTIEQLVDAIKALHVTLTPEEIKYLEEPYQPKALL